MVVGGSKINHANIMETINVLEANEKKIANAIALKHSLAIYLLFLGMYMLNKSDCCQILL